MALRHGLFVTDPDGTEGVTTPQDARLALAGLLSGPGVVSGGVVSGTSDTPNMKYSIAAGVFAVARGTVSADGLYLVPNDGALTVDSETPAPSSGSRYDLIWVRQKNGFDGGFGDTDSDPDAGVTVGTAGSPGTKPYDDVPDGALVLAEAQVGANIASSSLATITLVADPVSVTPKPGGAWSAIRNTGASIPGDGTWTDVPMTTQTVRVGGPWLFIEGTHSGPGIVEDGTYMVSGSVAFPTTDVSKIRGCRIQINGTTEVIGTRNIGAMTGPASGAAVVNLSAGDVIRLQAYQNSGSSASTTSSLCGLSVVRLA